MPLQAAPPCQQLPAASFGGIKFPDIQHLESAGKDCILGCSSIGSVALWNFARYADYACRHIPRASPVC